MSEPAEKMPAVIQSETLPASANQIRAQVNLIQEVMESVMQPDVHYGKIPGCGDKPTLLKAGAEKIMATFRLAADPEVEDLSGPDEARFRVKVRMTSPSGVFVGAGIGECSSDEEKYKWRRTYIDEEFAETPDDRKRNKWFKVYGKPAYKQMQIRTNIADVRNTVLKMAKKRALMDAVLTATAASDIFTQDIEDLPSEIRENVAEDNRPAGVKSQEQPSPEKEKLVKELEAAAQQGWAALQTKWQAMTDKDRKLIGADFGRIKKIAEAVK